MRKTWNISGSDFLQINKSSGKLRNHCAVLLSSLFLFITFYYIIHVPYHLYLFWVIVWSHVMIHKINNAKYFSRHQPAKGKICPHPKVRAWSLHQTSTEVHQLTQQLLSNNWMFLQQIQVLQQPESWLLLQSLLHQWYCSGFQVPVCCRAAHTCRGSRRALLSYFCCASCKPSSAHVLLPVWAWNSGNTPMLVSQLPSAECFTCCHDNTLQLHQWAFLLPLVNSRS